MNKELFEQSDILIEILKRDEKANRSFEEIMNRAVFYWAHRELIKEIRSWL